MVKLDMSILFSIDPCDHMLSVIWKHCRKISRFVHFAHMEPSILIASNKSLTSECVVQQGNPLGPNLSISVDDIAQQTTMELNVW